MQTLKSVDAVRCRVAEEMETLRLTVFEQPPADWAGFQAMLGSYRALNSLSAELQPETGNEDKT